MTYKHLLGIVTITHAVRVFLVLALLQQGIVHSRSVLQSFSSLIVMHVCVLLILIVSDIQFFLLITRKVEYLPRCLGVEDRLESTLQLPDP